MRLVFSGRDPDGTTLPDGVYYPVVRLVGDHRTITLPNPITLDTKAPRVVRYPHDLRRLISPGSVGQPHFGVAVPYTLSSHGHGLLFVDGHRVTFTYRQRLTGVLEWDGMIARKLVAPGAYTLEIAVQDQAGNRSKPVEVGQVTVRYLELAAARLTVRPRERFNVHILIGPARVSWLFAARRGSASSHVLHLRAPKRRGRYRLYVTGSDHDASALVVVS